MAQAPAFGPATFAFGGQPAFPTSFVNPGAATGASGSPAATNPTALYGQGPFTAVPGAPQPTDNVTLSCASNQMVLANADMLHMLSPTVLGGALEAARGRSPAAVSNLGSEPSGSEPTGSSPPSGQASSSDGRLRLPMQSDSAADWLTALKLVHPGIMPDDRPVLDWATAERVLKLADKYGMNTVMALCSKALASFLRSGTGAPTTVAPLMEMLATATRLRQADLSQACQEVICKRLQVPGPAASADSSQFLKDIKAWLSSKVSTGNVATALPVDMGFSMALMFLNLYEISTQKKPLGR